MECEAADEEFEDLFSGVESVTNSSQKSTTYSSADSLFDIEANERIPFHPGDTPSSSSPFNSHDYKLDSCDIAAAGGAADIEGAHSLVKNHPLQAKVYPLKRERKESKFDQSSNETPLEGDVMTKVEKIFEAMLDSLLDQSSEMAVTLRTRHKQHDEEDVMHNARSYRTRRLAFPGRSENEAWRFSTHQSISLPDIETNVGNSGGDEYPWCHSRSTICQRSTVQKVSLADDLKCLYSQFQGCVLS